jgi:serine-aspartate repeat-containing protein C/D/E
MAWVLVACLLGTAAGHEPDTLWVSRIDLGGDELGTGVDSRGNAIAVTGYFGSSETYDWLVARLNQDGDTIWTRTISDSLLHELAHDACIDAESNVLVAGSVQSTGSLYCRVPALPGRRWGRSALTQDQMLLALTAKYDSLGELEWLRADTNCLGIGIACDSAGNSYVSGTYFGGTYLDLWLAKLNPAGESVWTRTFDFDLIDIGYRLALDASGNLAAAAYVGDGENFDCVTLKLTPDGDTIWTRINSGDAIKDC